MYKPADPFTNNILQIFIARVGVVLSKLNQKVVNDFRGKSFAYCKRNEGNSFISISMNDEPDIVIMWDKKGVITTNNEQFASLQTGSNLEFFTSVEQKIMKELIKKEKEITIAETVHNIINSEPLGFEFEQVLEKNLSKLYEN